MRVTRCVSPRRWWLATTLCLVACGASQAPSPSPSGTAGAPGLPAQLPEGGASHTNAAAGGRKAAAGAGSGAVTTGLCAPDGNCEERVTLPAAAHVLDPIVSADPPPAGGPHNPCWASWGVHTRPLPPEYWVHNLEHGGVVLLYHCPDGCSDEVAQLQTFVAAHERTLLTEYAQLPQRFAIVAWGYRLLMTTLDVATLDAFYMMRFNHAPENIGAGPPTECPSP